MLLCFRAKRAAWRYANDRAAVASRWTWLQAQISDLEYRIRQHNELHRQIRACKGAVALADAVSDHRSPPPEQQEHVDVADDAVSPSAVNGYRGQLPGATTSPAAKPGDAEQVCKQFLIAAHNFLTGNSLFQAVHNGTMSNNSYTSARTRPLNRTTFRKRKLIQTTGLHALSKKAGRPSNIRCGCVDPVVPCALCTGRADPTFPRDMPEQLTVPERIALLDPGFHPVLSFPDGKKQLKLLATEFFLNYIFNLQMYLKAFISKLL